MFRRKSKSGQPFTQVYFDDLLVLAMTISEGDGIKAELKGV